MPSMKVLDEKTGEKRDLTPDEVSQLIDEGVILNESGADLLTRWLTKTFAANPAEAKGFLERRGFEVMPGKKSGEFAIRNPHLDEALGGAKNNKWKVLDPRGFDLADIADVTFDIFAAGPLIAAGTAAGAVTGGLPGAVAGGGASSTGVEAGRQLLGSALGVNTQTDPSQLPGAATAGAVFPVIGQYLGKFPAALLRMGKSAGTKAALLAKNLAARVAGATEEDLVAASASAPRAAAIMKEQASKPEALLDSMRGTIQQLRDKGTNQFPETREMQAILQKARPIPLKGLMKVLTKENVQPVGDERVGLASGRKIAEDIAHKLGFNTVDEAAAGTASAKEVESIKQTLQGQIDWSGRPGEKFLNRTLKEAQGNLANRLQASIPSPAARARYRFLNGFSSYTDSAGKFHSGRGVVGKMEALNGIDKKMGEHLKTQGAETFLEKVTGQGRTQERRLVDQFDHLFGTDFVEQGLTTRLSAKFSADAPRITATGGLLGASAGGSLGAGAGGAVGGPGGAAVGGALGSVAGVLSATPKGALRIGRGVTNMERTGKMFLKGAGSALRKVEPLLDYLGRTGSSTAAAIAPGALLPSHATPDEENP